MKLLFCLSCTDVIRLIPERARHCSCRRSGGVYIDGINAVIWGNTMPLGFDNKSLAAAIMNQPDEGLGMRFEAFVIPKKCPSLEVIKKPRARSRHAVAKRSTD